MKNFLANIFNKIKGFVINNKWWSALIIIVILAMVYFLFLKVSDDQALETTIVAKRNISEVVSVTGKIRPISNVDLTFEKSGRVSYLAVSVGDKVYKGQYLASVSNADLVASVEQAKANVKIAEANLAALHKGSTPEQIALDEMKVQKAQADLVEAKNTLVNSLNDSYTKADDSIRNKTDILFSDPRGQGVELKFNTDFQLENDIEATRPEIERILNAWAVSLLSLNNDSDLNMSVTAARNNLSAIQEYLEKIALAVNNLNPDSNNTQTTIDTWKVAVYTARTNIDLAISSLSTSASGYSATLYALRIAENQFAITKSGATVEQVAVQEATVDQAKASLNNAYAQLEKTILRSPINGVVTKVDIKVGESAQAGVPSISIVSLGKYEIESFVPEADIAKIKIGNIATTTFDAYGSGVFFQASVMKIDPAETLIDNIPTYKITLILSVDDERIKSGMTANLDILTNQKEAALVIPARSTYMENSIRYVDRVEMIDEVSTIEKTEIKTGLRGNDGYMEIISGLNEGDKIIALPSI